MSDDRLAGRVVLVTGAARGIGRGLVDAVAAAGGSVVACDTRAEVREVTRVSLVADAASGTDMARAVELAVGEFGGLDVVVANAGAAEVGSKRLEAADAVAIFDRMIDANLRTAYVTVRAALPHLLAAERSDIVLVSTDHVCPRPDAPQKTGWMDGYDAAKWGLQGISRNWAATLAGDGVRVNTLAMGETDTPMLRDFLAARGVAADQIDEMASEWLTVADVAAVAVDLLAEHEPARTDTVIGLWPGHPAVLPRLRSGSPG